MNTLLSPGIAYACFDLIQLLSDTPIPVPALKTIGKVGVVQAKRVADCALTIGWLAVDDMGQLVPTSRGRAVLEIKHVEGRLREVISDLIDATNPPWLQNARFGRRHLLRFAPSEVRQVFDEAGLSHSQDNDIVRFWDSLAAKARGLRDISLNETGRLGERLTMDYERLRTKREPKWVAIESNEDGYDVLSVVSENDTGPLCIEVKASEKGMAGSFFITRNEWDTFENLMSVQIHLWDISGTNPTLAVITTDDLMGHIPKNNGDGRWMSTSVPFRAFETFFIEPSSTH